MSGMVGLVDAPSYDTDIYTTDAIVDPYPHYRRLRELGPVVWLSRHKVCPGAPPWPATAPSTTGADGWWRIGCCLEP